MDRLGRFDDRARKALTLAQDEAKRYGHTYIGTEHLLLGLLRDRECGAARVLERMGVELARVRTALEFIIGRGDRPAAGEVGLTPRAKRCVELAIDEARRLGHHDIRTEHLLLGIVREGEGIAAGVLESLGVNLDKVRHETIRRFTVGSESVASPTGLETGADFFYGRWGRAVPSPATGPDVGDLKRVIGIGRTLWDNGAHFAVLSLELYERAAIVAWLMSGPGDKGMSVIPTIGVADDQGTAYATMSPGAVALGSGLHGLTLVQPGPPEHAGRFIVEVVDGPADPAANDAGQPTRLRCEIDLGETPAGSTN